MHTPGELLAQAGAVGLVTHREVLDGVVGVRDESRSNAVHAILVRERPVAYVKQRIADSVSDGDDAISRERGVLHALEELDDLVPHLVGGATVRTEWSDTIWVCALPGTDLHDQRGRLPELAAICHTWGTALAELHQAPAQPGAPMAPQPWVLHPQHHRRSLPGAPANSAYGRILAAAESRAIRAAAQDVASRWTTSHWIHGDLCASNVFVDRSGWLRVRFVDFDRGGLGDPGWDVAAALDTLEGLAGLWRAPSRLLTGYFLHGYRHAGGPGQVSDALRAVRAVATAWLVASDTSAAGNGGADVEGWLGRARKLAADRLVRAA